MKKFLLNFLVVLSASNFWSAQTVTVFDNVPFYSMYNFLGPGENLPPEAFSEIPAGSIRMHAYERDVISRKLSASEISMFGSSVTMNIDIIAACDNYDRFAGVSLAMVPKGSSTYTWDQTDVKRIELGRIITPFLNKNVSPTSIPYSFQLDNLSKIINNPTLAATYDFWIEFRADGYSAAAQTQVAGCANRFDVFRGNLKFVSSGTSTPAEGFLLPLKYRENLNNYNATDVPGTTTRIVNFSLAQNVDNAQLFLSMSNHGANSGGEEYIRRQHYIYLDDQLIFQYKPNGRTCEDYRAYNTQGNGIYGSTPKSLRNWLSFSNWCPGAAIPNRQIPLGNLSAGNHSIKITVPTAVFANGEGYFPISMYIQNSTNGQVVCSAPLDLQVKEQIGTSFKVNWAETGNATNWQSLSGRKNAYAESYDVYQENTAVPEATRDNLTVGFFYEMYVKSKCTNDNTSEWVGPVYTNQIKLGTNDLRLNAFSIYPNPVKESINIRTENKISNMIIYDMEGKKIMTGKSPTLNVSKLITGNYMIVIKFEDGKTSTQKFIKE